MTKNYAHRGFSGKYPENTMLAFTKAVETGCDGIEFDVHLSADGQVVIIHDEKLDRTTNGSGWVKDHTLAQLQALDASATFRGVYGVCPIPTLEEYYEMLRPYPQFLTNIELKTGVFEYPELEKKTLEIIDRFDRRATTIISAFNHFSILRMKALAPDIKTAFLEESWIIGMGEYTARHGVDCIHPFLCNLTPEHFAEMKAHGREVNTWTVNEKEHMQQLLALGVDGIITNYPDLLQSLL